MKKTRQDDFKTKEFRVCLPFTTKAEEGEDGKIIKIKGWANYCGDVASDSVFVDHCGDVMVPSGFDLGVWNKNPQILWNHDRAYTIGKGLKANKKKEGLEIEAEIHEKACEEEDFYRIEKGLVSFLSVGFRTQKGEWKKVGDKEVFFITKSLLYEVSVVSIPMNSESGFSLIKSFNEDGFYAGDFPEDDTVTDIETLPEQEINKTSGDDTMKLKYRDILPEDAVKAMEAIGLTADLDAERDVDTKTYIDTTIAKAIAQLKAELTVEEKTETKEEETKSEEQPTGDEGAPSEEENTQTPNEEAEKHEEELELKEEELAAIQGLADALEKTKAFVG